MTGNALHRFDNAAIVAMSVIDAQQVVTSAELDERLADTYRRVHLRPGLLESMVGVRERRWWTAGFTYIDGAVAAGAKALGDAGIDPADVGLLVNTSVSRAHLEPSNAVAVHDGIGLPTSCRNFDITNACLGFVNGLELGAMMVDSGAVDYALVVAGEDSRTVQEATLDRLSSPSATARDVMAEFATLTLGSGAVAMVVGRADRHPEGHRLVQSVTRAGTEHHQLCIGDNDGMRTDLKGLLDAGLALGQEMWEQARGDVDWHDGMDRYVMHQVSQVHTDAMCLRLGIDPDRVPRSFPARGNIGPASVPVTLALEADRLSDGDRVLLMGIGSGLNVSCLELAW